MSNTSISMEDSNGRTLANLLSLFTKDEVFNFYLHGQPQFDRAHFYRLSDREALHFRKKGTIPEVTEERCPGSSNPGHGKRTNFRLLAREHIWSRNAIRRAVVNLAKSIHPRAVLLLVADSAFLIRLAIAVSRELRIPLIAYNAEDYYFKDYDYVTPKASMGFFHKRFKKRFARAFESLQEMASGEVFFTEDLMKLYQTAFPTVRGEVVYNSASVEPVKARDMREKSKTLLYAGGLGAGRFGELRKIGRLIREIDPEAKLVVYSGSIDESLLAKAKECPDFEFRGKVSYDEINRVSKEALVILHVDGTDPLWAKYATHALSTKIADSLGSGIPLFVRTNPNSALANYLEQYQCAYCATTDEQAKTMLTEILRYGPRQDYVTNALLCCETNHNLSLNAKKARDFIVQVIANDEATR